MPSESFPWRHGFWVAGLVAMVWLACFRFPVVWLVTGIGEANRPFIDLYGILAACDAVRAGVDPFLPNNFDPYHRPFVYSDWWLELGRLGLGRADTLWLGFGLVAAVLLMAVVIVRPGTRREGVALCLLLASPAVLLAVNRANNDLVVFLLISFGLLCFRDLRWPARALGIVLFAMSAVLKYSPLVTLVVLLDLRSRRALAAGLGLYGLVLLLAAPGLLAGFKSAAHYSPAPDWLYAFGAPVFGRNLGLTATVGWLAPAGLLGAWAAFSARRRREETVSDATPARQTAEREFMCGAALLAGLFFLGSTYAYKLIFALWLLPWLGQQSGETDAGSRWSRVTWYLLLAVVWLEGLVAVGLNLLTGPASKTGALQVLTVTLAVTQLLTWALVACLMRFLFIYAGQRSWTLLRGHR